MAFTTWTALKTAILDDLAAGSVRTKSYTTPMGHKHEFQSLKEVQDFLQYCDSHIAAESGDNEAYVQFDRPGPGI